MRILKMCCAVPKKPKPPYFAEMDSGGGEAALLGSAVSGFALLRGCFQSIYTFLSRPAFPPAVKSLPDWSPLPLLFCISAAGSRRDMVWFGLSPLPPPHLPRVLPLPAAGCGQAGCDRSAWHSSSPLIN